MKYMEIALVSKSSLRIKGKSASFLVDPQSDAAVNAFLLLNPDEEFISEQAVTVSGAGEYEIGGVKITGLRNEKKRVVQYSP